MTDGGYKISRKLSEVTAEFLIFYQKYNIQLFFLSRGSYMFNIEIVTLYILHRRGYYLLKVIIYCKVFIKLLFINKMFHIHSVQ